MMKLDARIKKTLKRVADALETEAVNNRDMIATYIRFSAGKATKLEMEKANEQFRNFLKTLGLGIFAILPLAPITIPLMVKWGNKFGIDIIPSSFRDSSSNEKKLLE